VPFFLSPRITQRLNFPPLVLLYEHGHWRAASQDLGRDAAATTFTVSSTLLGFFLRLETVASPLSYPGCCRDSTSIAAALTVTGMPPLPRRQTTMVSRCPFGLARRHLLTAVELAMETELWSDRFRATASGVAAVTACGACAVPAGVGQILALDCSGDFHFQKSFPI
jgi:hypothetical protein